MLERGGVQFHAFHVWFELAHVMARQTEEGKFDGSAMSMAWGGLQFQPYNASFDSFMIRRVYRSRLEK